MQVRLTRSTLEEAAGDISFLLTKSFNLVPNLPFFLMTYVYSVNLGCQGFWPTLEEAASDILFLLINTYNLIPILALYLMS